MTDSWTSLRPWVLFAGCVLVVLVLYWAQALLVPIALSVLLTFVLTPPVKGLQKVMGRVPAVLLTAALTFAFLGLIGWGVAMQLTHLADDLDGYRNNITQKIADVRAAGRGGSVEKVQETIEEIKSEIERAETPRGTVSAPVIVQSDPAAVTWGPPWLSPLLEPLARAGLVSVLVIFMLLEREELRGRLLGLFGHGHLAVTTKAFDEAGKRVSRQLLMQTLVNVIYGVCAAVGLLLLGVPYPWLWGALGGVLRFVPYLGPVIAAGAPIVVSLAALPGWIQPFKVMGLFLALELFTNLVLETVLYAGAAGVSQVALLIAVAFWTWLWGPLGLLMAVPLTVCVIVLGKHVPGLEFLSTLMADAPVLSADMSYYQRLLARDQSEASDIVDRYVKAEAPETVYDALLLPALNYAERDRVEGRLSPDEESGVIESTKELLNDAMAASRAARMVGPDDTAAAPEDGKSAGVALPAAPPANGGASLEVLAYPVNGASDELALRMLAALLADTSVKLEIVGARMLSSEMAVAIRERSARVICIADLPPSPPSKTRYLLKRLRTALPEVKIIVGRWAPPVLADENARLLMDGGAAHVASTLVETRDQLLQLAQAATPEAGQTSGTAA